MAERDKKGRFMNGNRGKPPGSGHALLLRQAVQDLLERNFDQVETDLLAVGPKERLRIYARLMQFVLPRLEAVAVSPLNSTSLEDFIRMPLTERIEFLREIRGLGSQFDQNKSITISSNDDSKSETN